MSSGTPEGDVNLTSRRSAWQLAHLDEATADLLAKDAEVFLHQSLSTPCLNGLAKALGTELEDLAGRRYLDFHGNSVHQVGYGHPLVVSAIKEALDTLPFSPRRYTNVYAVKLAQRLVELAPREEGRARLGKVLFAPGGAEAMGIAIKLVRMVTGRHKTISMWDSFHGASLDTISIGGESFFRSGIGPLMSGCEHVPPPDPDRCPLGCGGECALRCADYVEYVLEKEGDVAAVIAEPIRCTTAAMPPPGYWKKIRAACDRHGALLVFDEIPICLGRTGDLFASQTVGVIPDILVFGKGLGGGIFPMAAVLARSDFDIAGHVALGHYTHEKSPVGCAAGLATLDVIEREGLVARSREKGAWFVAELKKLQPKHACIKQVRGVGMQMALELTSSDLAEALMYACLDRGMSFKVSSGTVITLTPPLTITDAELVRSIEIIDASLTEISPETRQ